MLLSIFTLFLLASTFSTLALVPNNVKFRNGKASDTAIISLTMLKELMNPLHLQPERFIVATTTTNDTPIGWAQIRPIGTAKRDPSTYNSKPGSFDVQQDADDTMWQEFEEEEDTVVPVGLASLPWTKEYKEFANAAKRRRERRAEIVEREEANMPMLYELASVYVKPEYRRQGIGRELIRRVLQKHKDAGRSVSNVYLLTLASTVGWYNTWFGFELVPDDEAPQQMSFEIAAGKLVTRLIGAKLCCMRGVDSD